MNTERFIDDNIVHIESDIEKVQTKPNMYISFIGERGALHLCKEIINNCVDECINTNSPGRNISVLLDEIENTITVTDDGRGIGKESMKVVCTTLQSGSKFTREGTGENSAGENGCGLTACNALAERFEIIVNRYGERYSVRYAEGKLVEDVKTTKTRTSDKHGTTVILKPSRYYLGEDCDIPADKLMDWLDKLTVQLPKDIVITLTVKCKGGEPIINKKYKNKDGLYGYVKRLCERPLLDPVTVMTSRKMNEKYHDREISRHIGLELAFTYDSNSIEFVTDSFCNYVNTIDGGTHVDAVKQAIMQYLVKQTKDSLSEREANKLDITFNDATQGLVLCVYLSTTYQPSFTGQTKQKLDNSALFRPIKDMAFQAISKYFADNQKELKKCIDRVKLNAKARVESTKARNAVIKTNRESFTEHMMANFNPANNTGKNEYRELFIIEGKSAKGSSSYARFDRDTQAVFSIRGVPLNTFGLSLDKVLANDELRDLVTILHCNIGARFNMDDLYYDKIIILSDSDADGYFIASSLCTFFCCHLPKVVEAGRIYKSVAPLYELKGKGKKFVLNKQEYVEVFEQEVRKNVSVYDGKEKLSDKAVQELLLTNRLYLEDLMRIANHFAVDPILLEYIIIHIYDKDFRKKFSKKYPELDIVDDVLVGIYEGKHYTVILDKVFTKRVDAFRQWVTVNNNKMYYTVKEKSPTGEVDKGLLSLGEFLSMIQKYQPPIKTRFKGVGELDPGDLRDTVLDPNNRILIQLTAEDIDREREKLRILHGNDSDARKLLMQHFKISREDLDN